MYLSDTYQLEVDDARELISQHPFAMLLSTLDGRIRATYCLALLEPDAHDLTLVGHVAKADPQSSDVLEGRAAALVFNGPQGYVSASWYRPHITRVPSTWNYMAVHVHGQLQALEAAETMTVLQRTVRHMERALPPEEQWVLEGESLEFAERIAKGVVGFRLQPVAWEAKAKLSQDMPPAVQQQVRESLQRPGPYRNSKLAAAMDGTVRPEAQ